MTSWLARMGDELAHTLRTALHVLAMITPNSHLKRSFYRLRGTAIGNNVDIANFVFLEDIYPELITIGDNVDIAPGVIIATHDSVLVCFQRESAVRTAAVHIQQNVYIGAGAIVLPGVTIGEQTIIGAGSVVVHDIPPFSVAYGIPAKVQCSTGEWLAKKP